MFRESLEPTSRMLRDYGFGRRSVKRSGLHPVKFGRRGRRAERNECRSLKIERYEAATSFPLNYHLDIARSEGGKTNNGGCSRATLFPRDDRSARKLYRSRNKKEGKKDGSKENGNSVNFKIAINLAAFFRYAPLFASLKQKPFVSTDFKKVFRKFMRYLAVIRRGEYRAPFARVS